MFVIGNHAKSLKFKLKRKTCGSLVVRGLAPVGPRSGPKNLRALRTRTGASPLATKPAPTGIGVSP
ncbi:hypothetical protein EI534_26950 [Pseudomonas frederiksbergensis]|nr:hypothetical protein [Pseudomonas frederiksbergensis]